MPNQNFFGRQNDISVECYFTILDFICFYKCWEMREKHLKWLSKAVTAINLFNGGVQASIIIAENIFECKCVK